MKEKGWIITIVLSALAVPGIFLILTLINDWKWRAFYIPLGIVVGLLLIGGIIYMFYKFKSNKIETVEVDIKEAVEFTKHEILYEEDNPDNLKVEEVKLRRVGEYGQKGVEPTPVLAIYGKGTEMNQNRVIIRNMNDYKKQKSSLIDPTPEEIVDAILSIAEYPSNQITEEIRQSLEHGIPITYIKRTTPSSTSTKKEMEKQEAEKENAM